MGKCVYCGNLSNNQKKATLHRFPRDAALCKQWLKIIGRENWVPAKHSFLCSDHFSEDCFNIFHNRKCLKLKSLPTISTHKEVFQEHTNILVESNHGNINESTATSVEVPEADMIVESNESPTTSREIYINESTATSVEVPEADMIVESNESPTTSREIFDEEESQLMPANIRHDHHYVNTPRSTLKKLNSIRKRLQSTQENNKKLKRQVKHLRVKVRSLKEIAKGLRERRLLPENAFYNLSALENTSLELFNRMLKNRKGKISRDKYPPSLRAFALTVHFYSPKAYCYMRKTFDLALPHPDVLRTWYTSVEAEPGFTEESFNTLKEKSDNLKESGEKLVRYF